MGGDDYCCVPLCNHKRSKTTPCTSFYTIPREPQWLYEQWKSRIKRFYRDESGKVLPWEATDNHRICDCHFTEEEKATSLHPKSRKPGRKLVLPSIFPRRLTESNAKPRTTSKSTNRQLPLPVNSTKRRKLLFATPQKDESSAHPADTASAHPEGTASAHTDDTASCSNDPVEGNKDLEALEQSPDSFPYTHGHDYVATQRDATSYEMVADNPSLKEFIDTAGKQQEMADNFQKLNEKCQVLSLDNVKEKQDLFRYYTGFSSYEVFDALFRYLEPKASIMKYPYGERTLVHSHYQTKFSVKPGTARKFSLREEMFMTLVRLRVGVPVVDMATRYGVAESTYSSIFTAWVCLLAIELEKLCKVSDRQDSARTADCFADFQNLKIILDCTELFAETPSTLSAHKQTFSNYKHHSTMKFLVGMNAGGAITYISEMYGGHSSDKYITSESKDLLESLNAGEKVMVDRGFTISEDLPPGVHLIMPSFKHKNKAQFLKEELRRNKKISEARVHIERAIRRIKQFEIFAKEMKLKQKDIYENMFKACAYLVNFQDPFIKV